MFEACDVNGQLVTSAHIELLCLRAENAQVSYYMRSAGIPG